MATDFRPIVYEEVQDVWADYLRAGTNMSVRQLSLMKDVGLKYESALSGARQVVIPVMEDSTLWSDYDGSDFTYSDVTLTDETIELTNWKKLNKRVLRKNASSTEQAIRIVKKVAYNATIQLSDLIDTMLMAHYVDIIPANVINAESSPITIDKSNVAGFVSEVFAHLANNDVPEQMRRLFVPNLVQTFVEQHYQYTGIELQRTLSGRVVGSSKISTVEVGGETVYRCIFMAKDCIQAALGLDEMDVGDLKPYNVGTYLMGLVLYGSKFLDALDKYAFLVHIKLSGVLPS